MDGIDFRILAALHEDGLSSQAKIGRRVGLTAPAVARRLGKLHETGSLQGFRADVHSAVFGTTSTMQVLGGPHDEADVKQALHLPGVIWVAWKVDGGMTVMSYGDTDLSLLGDVTMTMPGDGRRTERLSRVGRRVLQAVVREPRAGRDALAKRSGLSPKTCAKHRDGAIQRGDLAVVPVLGSLRGEGAIVYHAAVFGDVASANIGAALVQAVLVNEAPGVQYWFCMAPDLATALTRQGAVEATGARARITMNRRLIQNDDRIVRWLEQEHDGSA